MSHTVMDISEYGNAKVQNERSSKKKEISAIIWQRSSRQNNIQPDGEKTKNNHPPKKNMSSQGERRETFKDFPKFSLIEKLCNNGYYFIGKNDTTVCFRCGAEVAKWKEDDNPSIYHDAGCSFNNLQNKETMRGLEGFQEPTVEDIPSEFCESILDTPITNTNTFPTPLRPEMAEISSSPNPSIVSKSNVSSNSEVEIQTEKESAPTSGNHLHFPTNVAEFEPLHSSESKNLHMRKEFVKKVAKKEKPLIVMGDVHSTSHQQLLFKLDLHTEEDRRKTFSGNPEAMKRFRNVVNYKELAHDGFFYLGNDVRTQCFSCQKVVKIWMAGDNVNQVHRECVPYCRMANGNETFNVPLATLQRSGYSSQSNQDFFSSPSEGYIDVPESSDDDSQSQSYVPSHKAQSIISHAAVYTKPKMEFEQEPTSVTRSQILQERKYTKPTPVISNESPLDLSRPHQPIQTRHADIPFISSTEGKQTNSSVFQDMQSRVVKLPHNNLMNLGSNEPQNEEETIPSILLPRSSSRISNIVVPPESTSASIYSRSYDKDVSVSHGNIPQLHGIQPQDEEINPLGSGPSQIHSTPNVQPLPSYHLDQTTLCSTTCPNDVGGPSASAGVVCTSASSSSENPWKTIFPCQDPARPGLASAVARQETFDYRWALGAVNVSIDEFARAGFYYTGEGDQLRCWYCNGEISNWNRDDDPWMEHARIFPECEFVLQQKGPEFVSNISSRYRNFEARTSPVNFRRSSSSSSSNSSLHGSPRGIPSHVFMNIIGNRMIEENPSPSSPPRVIDPRVEEERKRRELELALASESVLQAVEMGFEMRKIRKILKRKISSSGSSFSTPEALMESMLEAPANMSSSSESEDEGNPSSSHQLTNLSSTTASTSTNQYLFTSPVSCEKKTSTLDGAEDLDPRALDMRLREYQHEKRCKVCLDRDADVVFDPCGHLCTCVQCAENLRNCPMCRKRIKRSMRVYTS